MNENTIVFGLKNSNIYNETVFDDFSHQETFTPRYIKANLKPEFIIRFESQVAIAVRQTIIGSNVYSDPICYFDSYLIDEAITFESIVKQCVLQVGEYDFDNDDVSEIVFAFGKRGVYLKCYIF
ncbi:MAG: hypothetical protein IPJ06_14975 [Saprospiraceae bacterium]|nr:hypothetical protein [Saprospiraceae bacterium]